MRGARISKAIMRRLEAIASDRIVVATVRTVTRDDVGAYGLFGLAFADGQITAGEPARPSRSAGKWATRNLDGWAIKRKDLPKEGRDISNWAPDWRGSGHHLVTRTIDAWPVDQVPARLWTISATVIEHLKDAAIVRFRVDRPLKKGVEGFANDLSFALALLREAIGNADVFPADMTDDEYARIQRVDWELLPPGASDRVLDRMAAAGRVEPERLEVARSRLKTLERLGHEGFVVGRGKFANYFGAKFGDRAVALENLEYGNALYLFEENWEELSQLSRSELIRRRDPLVHRIPHLPGWQSALRQFIRR